MVVVVEQFLQAAWIVDDSDEENLASDDDADDDDDDGMVLDEGESGLTSQEGAKDSFFEDDDQASLNLRDSDEETVTDSVMMVSMILTPFISFQ